MDSRPCSCCGSAETRPLLDFGQQPVCNRFLKTATESEALFPLGISVCGNCGLIFLTQNIPAAELQPRVDWIAYREAEGHLDDVVERIIAAGASPREGGSMLGISSHDTSTLDRFARKGFPGPRSLDMSADLGIRHAGAGIETIQSAITPSWAASFLESHAQADIVIARYILEHVHDVDVFLAAMKRLVRLDGFIAFEVPDFSVPLANFDYSSIWEEHTFYFTPATLRGLLERHGFAVREVLSYPYPLENSLIAVCQLATAAPAPMPAEVRAREVNIAKAYGEKFVSRRGETQSALARLAATGKIAVFGAGHLAAKFINLLGVAKYIAFVADDHPKKCGLFMPGSRLPIRPSAALAEEGILWCLLSLNPESEERVLKNLKPVFESGGIKTYSIFRASPRALPLDP